MSFVLQNNQRPHYADMQYLSFQVIKGLSYLREKHKIMHRGQSLFQLLKDKNKGYTIFKYMNNNKLNNLGESIDLHFRVVLYFRCIE